MSRVSPLKVRVFASCRLRYRYQYVERLPARLRIEDTAGSLVHRVLCDFFSKVSHDERNADRLDRLFEEAWDALSPRYRRMPGVDNLRSSRAEQLRRFAAQHDLRAEPFLVEPYVQVEVAPGVVLFGRMDRVDEEEDGTLHVIDYKTGSMPDEVDAGQLRLYAIMVEQRLGRIVTRLSFWYLDDGRVWTINLSDDDKRQIRDELLSTAREMERVTEYPPAIGPHCAHCPYLHACEVRAEIERTRTAEGW